MIPLPLHNPRVQLRKRASLCADDSAKLFVQQLDAGQSFAHVSRISPFRRLLYRTKERESAASVGFDFDVQFAGRRCCIQRGVPYCAHGLCLILGHDDTSAARYASVWWRGGLSIAASCAGLRGVNGISEPTSWVNGPDGPRQEYHERQGSASGLDQREEAKKGGNTMGRGYQGEGGWAWPTTVDILHRPGYTTPRSGDVARLLFGERQRGRLVDGVT